MIKENVIVTFREKSKFSILFRFQGEKKKILGSSFGIHFSDIMWQQGLNKKQTSHKERQEQRRKRKTRQGRIIRVNKMKTIQQMYSTKRDIVFVFPS